MKTDIAILGAGIIGSLTAFRLTKAGKRVRLFDELPRAAPQRASAVAAGLLAPYSERDMAPPAITAAGNAAIRQWREILDEVGRGIFFQQAGTLVVAHAGDEGLLQRLRVRLGTEENSEVVDSQTLRSLEPELDFRFQTALFFKSEAQIDAAALLAQLHQWLESESGGIAWESCLEDEAPFTFVIDCRGWKAQNVFPELRGVRGERFLVEAPGVRLNRPIRLMHPRYPLYVLPREDSQFVIGATVAESESLQPITLRSSLELLSGAYAIHSGLGEARVLESRVGIRPALPHALPEIKKQAARLSVNGLYRHGYLLGPAIADAVAELVVTGTTASPFYQEKI